MKPDYWKTSLDEVNALLSTIVKGEKKQYGSTSSGLPLWSISYGVKEDFRKRANYNSACGANNTVHYADRTAKKPVVMLVGGVHASEMEGVVALANFVQRLETGKDFRGNENPQLVKLAEQCRIVIVFYANPEGRERLEVDSVHGMSYEELRHYTQGNWKDGTICEWPDVKAVHPVIAETSYMGGYFNHQGINLMHDNFFAPMAEETKALFSLVEDEQPTAVLLFHGGANTINELLQPEYTPRFIQERVQRLAMRIKVASEAMSLQHRVRPLPEYPDRSQTSPPSFNLASALHHLSGAMAVTYETNQGLSIPNTHTESYEHILQHHYILLEELFRLELEEPLPF